VESNYVIPKIDRNSNIWPNHVAQSRHNFSNRGCFAWCIFFIWTLFAIVLFRIFVFGFCGVCQLDFRPLKVCFSDTQMWQRNVTESTLHKLPEFFRSIPHMSRTVQYFLRSGHSTQEIIIQKVFRSCDQIVTTL
jgi:hypothetical protein